MSLGNPFRRRNVAIRTQIEARKRSIESYKRIAR